MAMRCGQCYKASEGGKRYKRRYAKEGIALSGPPRNTKTCKKAWETCVRVQRKKMLKSNKVSLGDVTPKAESYCTRKSMKVKKSCGY